MKQRPKAIDRNGDLWVAAPTKHLLFRVLQDLRAALDSPPGPSHAQHLAALAKVEALLGLDRFDRALPPVHEQLGEPAPEQLPLMRNLMRLRRI